MKTKYEKPVCEVLYLETEEAVMTVSGRQAPGNPNVTTGGSSDEKNFWGR